ncbi:MAG: SRPBCC domain-containing protein [Acidobacteriia bacterium]|nr:SRPBCC domain-containing protein [Terriglobia bacterium]
MGKQKEAHAPIQQSVHVDCPPEDAFRLFTEEFAEWWPPASHSETENSEWCAIEPWVGGKIFERSVSGEEHEWGSVTVWDPPERVAFTWHPDGRRGNSQVVTVDFSVEADGTRVTLTHQGWQDSRIALCASRFAGFVSQQAMVAA